MRDRNKKSPSRRLDRLGSRLPSVWYQNLHNSRGPEAETVIDYMRLLVPGLSTFRTDLNAEDMLFYFADNEHPLLASEVSDGTLRALALLTAIFQPIDDRTNLPESPNVVCIEEPELYLHPGGMQLLIDAMRHPKHNKQIVVSSHSPVVLDALQPGVHLYGVG